MPKLIIRDRDQTALMDLGLEEGLVIGRSQGCGLPIQAPRASRRHAEILPATEPPSDGASHRLRDLQSTNGTLLNGAPFTGEVLLTDGDTLDVGGCQITYRLQP